MEDSKEVFCLLDVGYDYETIKSDNGKLSGTCIIYSDGSEDGINYNEYEDYREFDYENGLAKIQWRDDDPKYFTNEEMAHAEKLLAENIKDNLEVE